MEQEESTVPVTSATTNDTQQQGGSLTVSAEVSLHSPSPDTQTLSAESTEGNGENHSCDLSSDGKYEVQTAS